MKDIHSKILAVTALFPQVITAAALNSGDIDLQGFQGAQILFHIGDINEALDGAHKLALKLEHADEDANGNAGAYAACADADVNGWVGLAAGVFKTVNADAMEKLTYAIGYRGGKRFVKGTITPTGLAVGGSVAITVNKGSPAAAPAANQT